MKGLLLASATVLALSSLTSCKDDDSPSVKHDPDRATTTTSKDAMALATSLEQRYADEGEYPAGPVAIERLIEHGDLAPLQTGDRVHTYFRLTQHPGFLLCVVNDTSGAYAFYDSTKEGLVEGTTDPDDEATFDDYCQPTLVN